MCYVSLNTFIWLHLRHYKLSLFTFVHQIGCRRTCPASPSHIGTSNRSRIRDVSARTSGVSLLSFLSRHPLNTSFTWLTIWEKIKTSIDMIRHFDVIFYTNPTTSLLWCPRDKTSFSYFGYTVNKEGKPIAQQALSGGAKWKNLPDFGLSSRFFPVFPIFPNFPVFFLISPIFSQFFAVKRGTLRILHLTLLKIHLKKNPEVSIFLKSNKDYPAPTGLEPTLSYDVLLNLL